MKQTRFEFDVFLQTPKTRNASNLHGLKIFGVVFFVLFLFFAHQFSLILSVVADISQLFIFVIFISIMAGSIAIIYAVGSAFGKGIKIRQEAGRTKVTFSPENITFVKDLNELDREWDDFSKAKEDIDNFYLSIKNVVSFEIAKILFHNESQIKDFKDLLRLKLGDKAMLRK